MLTVYRELKGDLRYIFSLGLGVLGFYVTAITLIREFIGKTWYLLALVIGLLLLLVIVGVKYVKVTRLIKELHKIMCENNNMIRRLLKQLKTHYGSL